MTPTNPITEARKALEKENERWYSGLSVIDNANTPLRLEAIDAALSIAESQAAEIEKWKARFSELQTSHHDLLGRADNAVRDRTRLEARIEELNAELKEVDESYVGDMSSSFQLPSLSSSEIKAFRARMGWSQEELARAVGQSTSTVAKWERRDAVVAGHWRLVFSALETNLAPWKGSQ